MANFSSRQVLLLGAALAAAVFCLAAMEMGRPALMLAAKPLPVLLLAAFLWPAGEAFGLRVSLGLLFSAAGDVLLELGPQYFLWGVGAFFIAHLFYIAAFLADEKGLRPLAAIPAIVLGILVFPRLLPGLEGQGLLVPVLLYTLALCAMLWRALARRGGAAARYGALGAAAFAISDSLIALDRFAPEGAPVPHVRYAILILYWLGQLGITLSAPRAFR
jgi:alkenylglycerophosphocholine/alkenylglycerophosphoethanolamine hydrolase